MAKKSKAIQVDVLGSLRGGLDQFRDLDPNQPGQWPLLPRLAVWSVVSALVVVASWFL